MLQIGYRGALLKGLYERLEAILSGLAQTNPKLNNNIFWWDGKLSKLEAIRNQLATEVKKVTSGCYLVWFRGDLSRSDVQAYWRTSHGQIANKNPAINEYLQHHLSDTDHGFWPVPPYVGGSIPSDWKIDGMTEVRIGSMIAGVWARLFNMKAVFHDEQNIFDRCVAKLTSVGGGRWWTGPYQHEIGFRAVVFLRARHEYKGTPFRQFVETALAPALLSAGARELRTHVFQAGGRFTQWTPEVMHDEPVNRCYAGAIVIGTKNRAEFDRLLASSAVLETQSLQRKHCLAIHAYAVERTYPLTLEGQPQDSSWG